MNAIRRPRRLRRPGSPRRARSAVLLIALSLALPGAFVAGTPAADALMAPVDMNRVPPLNTLSRTLRNRRAPSDERVEAARQMNQYNEPASRRALERALRDRDPNVRAAAAGSLARVGDARSIRALERLRPDAEAWVRAAIGHALAALKNDTSLRARIRIGNITVGNDARGVSGVGDASRIATEELSRMIGRLPRTELNATAPSRPDDHTEGAVRAQDGVPYLRLDASILEFSYEVDGNTTTVRVAMQISISNDPGLLVRAVDTSNATVRGPATAANMERHRQRMIEAALRAAIEGASRSIDGGVQAVWEAEQPEPPRGRRRRR